LTVIAAAAASIVANYFQWRCVAKAGASVTIAHAVVLDDFSVVASGVIALSVIMTALVATTGRFANGSPASSFTSSRSPRHPVHY